VRELAQAELGDTAYRRDLSISYDKLGDRVRDEGRAAEATRLYQQSRQLREELAQPEPGNTAYRRDLALSYEALADLAVRLGLGELSQHSAIPALEHTEAALRYDGTSTRVRSLEKTWPSNSPTRFTSIQ